MGEVALFAAGVVVFAVTTTATLLFGYGRMQAAYERQVPAPATVDLAAEERAAASDADDQSPASGGKVWAPPPPTSSGRQGR